MRLTPAFAALLFTAIFADGAARLIGQGLAGNLGQQVVADNP